MNKVILIGRLTKEPEKKSTPSGTIITNFSIAVDRPFENKETKQREADFINCITFGKSAENLCLYCTKGSQIAVEGRIQVRNYDDSKGTRHYITEVICENITYLSKKTESKNDIETNTEVNDPYADMGDEVQLSDADLPFDFDE